MDEAREKRSAMDGASHVGYALAVLVPVVGLLVGLALIVRGDSDGPWIVAFSVAAAALYSAVLVLAVL